MKSIEQENGKEIIVDEESDQKMEGEIQEYIAEGLREGIEKSKKYGAEMIKNQGKAWEDRRRISYDDALDEGVAADMQLYQFSDAQKGFENGNYKAVIEVIKKRPIKEEETLAEERGQLNLRRLAFWSWEKLPIEEQQVINQQIKELDTKIAELARKRGEWVKYLESLISEPTNHIKEQNIPNQAQDPEDESKKNG